MGSWNERVQESTRLMQWGFNAWTPKPLFKKGAEVAKAKVQMGSSSEVPLVAPRDLAVTVPAGLSISGGMTVKVRYEGPIKAPIRKGQEIAKLVVTTGDTPPQMVPLVAGEDVGEAGFFGRAWNGLKSLFGLS
jgi:D-alanyl-D-alanine carboxypeptidase (penicillin-binding protein 5/6)